MTYLLDTNVCVAYLRGKSDAIRQKIEFVDTSNISLCSVVLMELIAGALRSGKTTENLQRIETFAKPYSILPFDSQCAEICAKIRHELEKIGQPIGPYDLQIAAITIRNNLTLVTHNTREFSKVANLKIEDWQID